jgi:hypothetical protein
MLRQINQSQKTNMTWVHLYDASKVVRLVKREWIMVVTMTEGKEKLRIIEL